MGTVVEDADDGQIKKKFPGVTVAVDKDRVEGCDLLAHPEKLKNRKVAKKCWNREFPAADYIVLDDAFQDRKLKTNKTVVLVDWNHPVQKDHLLPLGRLRDLPERIFDADVLIVTKCPANLEESEREQFITELGFTDYRGVISEPDATPPVWNVRIVSWVPGSPMDCAAMMPTASPTVTGAPVARLEP